MRRIPGGLNRQLVTRPGAAQLRCFAGLDDHLGQRGRRRPVLDAGAVGNRLQRRQVEFDHPLGDRVQQRRAGAEVERGGAIGNTGATVDLQMAQALCAVVGEQLYRRIAKFAAALVGIGLASVRYPGSVAAVHPRFWCQSRSWRRARFWSVPGYSIFVVSAKNCAIRRTDNTWPLPPARSSNSIARFHCRGHRRRARTWTISAATNFRWWPRTSPTR